MTELLSDPLIADHLAALPAWRRGGNEIRAEFRAPDFARALALVNAAAVRAEAADHHPDIDIRYNRVLFVLSTHSVGGLTEKDFELAAQIDSAAAAASAVPVG
jgi:4a-hydroxytetrahydrobiopterin dehydratase